MKRKKHRRDARISEVFTRNYRETFAQVAAFARRRVWDVELARDITAETYRVAWSKALDDEIQSLPQLYSICRNLIGDEIRTSRRNLLGASLIAPLDRPVATELEPFELAFENLSDTDQEVLKLKYWELLTAAESALVLGCTEEAAWARLSRARKNLKESLQKAGANYVSK